MTCLETLPKADQELIQKHLQLVIAANERTNLTRIDTPEEGMLLHVEDSLSALKDIQSAPDGLYGDLGSGAGFPGIPLAIAAHRDSILIDARQKKMNTVQQIIDELGLQDQIKTYAGRAELLARQMPGQFSVLTARALAKLPVLLELASPLLKMDGQLICYKANVEDQELNDAKRVKVATGMQLVNDRNFLLGDEFNRRILVFQKTAPAQAKLPRQEGMAQKKPL